MRRCPVGEPRTIADVRPDLTLAVTTRTGHLVHIADRRTWRVRHAVCRTLCGREWIDLHYSNVDPTAATCSPCTSRHFDQSEVSGG